MSTIIVLGGGGFLAGYIERHYLARGWRVVSIGRSATVSPGAVHHSWQIPHPEFAHVMEVEQPDIVVNAAGRASVPASMVEPLADFEASTLLNYRVLDDLRRCSAHSVFIHLSSAAVYGEPKVLPIMEDAVPEPISPYGWNKRLSELVLEEFARVYGIRCASLRIFSAYGASLERQVVWDLAIKALSSREGAIMLQGCPDDSRDFVHGSDVAQAVELVASKGLLVGEVYNLGSGRETRIETLANLVAAAANLALLVRFDLARRPGNPSRWHSDIGKLGQLGFEPRVILESGVAEVVERAKLKMQMVVQ